MGDKDATAFALGATDLILTAGRRLGQSSVDEGAADLERLARAIRRNSGLVKGDQLPSAISLRPHMKIALRRTTRSPDSGADNSHSIATQRSELQVAGLPIRLACGLGRRAIQPLT
jgi:hypothetical protein